MTLNPVTPIDLAQLIEQQLLKPDASRADLEKACAEARQHGFHSVCIHGSRVSFVAALLEESPVKLASVVGFPLGTMEADVKRYETEVAIDNGAQEINVVMNFGWLKEGNDAAILRELRDVVEAADERPVGVIIETHHLTKSETNRACHLITESGAKSVITATGFSAGATLVEDIKLLRELLGATFGVTAAGRVLDAPAALALLEAGATRLGTAEGVAILRQFESGL